MGVQGVWATVVPPLLSEVIQFFDEMRDLIHDRRRCVLIGNDPSLRRKRNMDGAATTLRGTDAQGRWLSQDRSVRVVTTQPPRQGAIHSAELFVHHGFKEKITSERQFQILCGFENK